MPTNVTTTIQLSDADAAAYDGLTAAADRDTFLVAKLAASIAPSLQSSLANSNVLALLDAPDQAALGALIAAVQALPAQGGGQ